MQTRGASNRTTLLTLTVLPDSTVHEAHIAYSYNNNAFVLQQTIIPHVVPVEGEDVLLWEHRRRRNNIPTSYRTLHLKLFSRSATVLQSDLRKPETEQQFSELEQAH